MSLATAHSHGMHGILLCSWLQWVFMLFGRQFALWCLFFREVGELALILLYLTTVQ